MKNLLIMTIILSLTSCNLIPGYTEKQREKELLAARVECRYMGFAERDVPDCVLRTLTRRAEADSIRRSNALAIMSTMKTTPVRNNPTNTRLDCQTSEYLGNLRTICH